MLTVLCSSQNVLQDNQCLVNMAMRAKSKDRSLHGVVSSANCAEDATHITQLALFPKPETSLRGLSMPTTWRLVGKEGSLGA